MTSKIRTPKSHILTTNPADPQCAEPVRPTPPDRLLPLRSVIEIAGLGKTMIYRLMRQGDFPQAYKPGGYASRWSERELIDWQATVAAKRARRGPPLP